MKKSNFLHFAMLVMTSLFAKETKANTLTINNGKPCQFAITILFSDGTTSSQGLGANPTVTMNFGATKHAIGVIFYDFSSPSTPAFTIGMTPMYTPFNMGNVAYCPMLVFCTWSQTRINAVSAGHTDHFLSVNESRVR